LLRSIRFLSREVKKNLQLEWKIRGCREDSSAQPGLAHELSAPGLQQLRISLQHISPTTILFFSFASHIELDYAIGAG